MKVKELLADPNAWTQGAMARGADGGAVTPVGSSSVPACKWCLLGAVAKCYHDRPILGGQVIRAIHQAISKLDGAGSLVMWNDAPGRTHAEVLALVTELNV